MMPSQKIPASQGLKLRRACGRLLSYNGAKISAVPEKCFILNQAKKVGELGGHKLSFPYPI